MHPAMTFTGTDVDLGRVPGTVFGCTGGEDVRETVEALVADLGARPVWVDEGQRVLYHAALTHGANHLVTLVNQATDLLGVTGGAKRCAEYGADTTGADNPDKGHGVLPFVPVLASGVPDGYVAGDRCRPQ